jgi:MoaA/NifB/PqqE/SkfB family radical SAM enzyme
LILNVNLPQNIQIETTTHCNLKCEYCVLKDNFGSSSTMSLDNFNSLKPYFKHFNAILLSGLAEPLMNKQIASYIRAIKEENKNCIVRIISNAMLLSEGRITELIDSGLDSFGFSIDSVDPTINDKVRDGSNILKILEDISLFNKIKEARKSKKPVFTATTVLQKANYKSLPGIIDKISDLGVGTFVINGLEPYSEDIMDHVLWGKENVPEDLISVLKKSIRIADKHQITVRLNDFFPKNPKCTSILMPIILPNGDVTACSVLSYSRKSYYEVNEKNQILNKNGENTRKIFGNIFKLPFYEIWNSKAYREFRNRVVNNDFPVECKGCLMKHGIICTTNATPPEKTIAQLDMDF